MVVDRTFDLCGNKRRTCVDPISQVALHFKTHGNKHVSPCYSFDAWLFTARTC